MRVRTGLGVLLALAAPIAWAPAALAQGKLTIDKRDCERLVVRHRPAPDVAYKPGVDVRGRPVKGADLSGPNPVTVPDVIAFDINIDLKSFQSSPSDKLGDVQAKIGRVRYDINSGKLTFNGKPLGDTQEAELARKCAEILGRGR